jgi:NAD(P)-dependent dehydrogenase (short-subunit alcohol dehydrogenase family)
MSNFFSLKNKTILVTGASSGIGRSIAIEVSKMGANLVITGRNQERLTETFNNLSGSGHLQFIADLTIVADIEKLVNNLPMLDGCVNNAGIVMPILIQFFEREDLNNVFNINTQAPILLTQSIVQQKRLNKNGSIVFISSIAGVFCSSVGGSLYSASKGAIHGFIKGVALDLAPKGIRVNSVNPGMVETGIFKDGTISEEQFKDDIKRYPLKRYGRPEDVAYAVIYLLSDASAWVTGTSLLIDGGFTLQ